MRMPSRKPAGSRVAMAWGLLVASALGGPPVALAQYTAEAGEASSVEARARSAVGGVITCDNVHYREQTQAPYALDADASSVLHFEAMHRRRGN